MRWWRRRYGAGPLHLLGLLACFAVAAYAMTRVFAQGGWKAILLWFAGCLIVHDLIAWPMYALADRLVVRWARRHPASPKRSVAWINHVRVPVVISAVLFLISSPLILRLSSSSYLATTGFTENVYVTNWLEVSGVLFAGSAAIYAARVALDRHRLSRESRLPHE